MSSPSVTIIESRKIYGNLTEVTYSVQATRPRTSFSGQPLIGGGCVEYTHVGWALVGTEGATVGAGWPRSVPRQSLCDAIFAAEHERRRACL